MISRRRIRISKAMHLQRWLVVMGVLLFLQLLHAADADQADKQEHAKQAPKKEEGEGETHVYSSNADSSANACFTYGCPFLPRDVFYDENAKEALHRLKEPNRKLHHEEVDVSKASLSFLSELDSSGDRNRTTMTLCGYKGGNIKEQINQDRSVLVSPFLGKFQLLGTLDGHGTTGEIVSEYARLEIPKRLAEKLEAANLQATTIESLNMFSARRAVNQIKSIITEVFTEIDKEAPKEAAENGGCTASIAFQMGSKLFVANAGDSVTVVGAYRSWNDTSELLYTTREDKPHVPEEKKRIEKAGGKVFIPKSFDNHDTSRVMFTHEPTGQQQGLAMSRSIGDWGAPGVIAEPVIDVLDLNELRQKVLEGRPPNDDKSSKASAGDVKLVVASATDGLIDYVTPAEIVDKFAITFYGSAQKNRNSSRQTIYPGAGHAHLAAEELIFRSSTGWHNDLEGSYRDDITVAAAKIFPWDP